MAETPPDGHPYDSFWGDEWADDSYRWNHLALGKQNVGWKVGEVPSDRHLNFLMKTAAQTYRVLARAMAPQLAFNNIEFTTTSVGPAQVCDSYHVDYDALADWWYITGIDASGNVYCNDSADGITWSSTYYPANVGAGSTGDASKMVTDGTYVAVAADASGQGKVFTSSDLTVANLDAGTNVGTSTTFLESSDLVYNGNGYWLVAGRSTTKGNVWSATDPTGTWTVRQTLPTNTDAYWLASNGAGGACFGGSTESYYTTNGTTWYAGANTPATTNNVAWSESLQLFVALENGTGAMWLSEDGDTWTDVNIALSIPLFYNIVHCDDFVLAWTVPTASTNGLDYYDVYAFHSEAVDRSNLSYTKLGTVWGDETAPYVSRLDGIFHSGQGKMIFPYNHATPTNDTYLAISRFGANNDS